MRNKVIWIIGSMGVAAILAIAIPLSGVVSVAATNDHGPVVRGLLKSAMARSVRFHARSVERPREVHLEDRALAEKAYGHYSVACTPCHGAPGQAAAPWMVTNPPAPSLIETASRWSDEELYWIVKNGIHMTGMPALGPTHKDEHLWAIAAFVRQLPTMTAEAYKAMGERHAQHQHHGGGM